MRGGGRGGDVSLCGLRQDQLVQCQIRDRSSETVVLGLELLEPLHLIAFEAAILIPPSNGMDGSPSTIQAESLQQEGELQ